MKQHFSWRIGLLVIVILVVIVLAVYPGIHNRETVPVREGQANRVQTPSDDARARQAVESDLNQ